MSISKELREFKRLYYESSADLLEVNLSPESGCAIFLDDGSEIEVSGHSDDFIQALGNIHATVREGEQTLIDVSDTPAGDSEVYYDNLEYFRDSSENPFYDAIERISNDEVDLPQNVSVRKALNASIELEMSNNHLKNLVEYYNELWALQMVRMKRLTEMFERYREDRPYDRSRFDLYYGQTEKVLRQNYLTKDPLDGYRSYHSTCVSDPGFWGRQLVDLKKKDQLEWLALSEQLPSAGSRDPSVIFQKREKVGDNEQVTGEVDGDHGVRRLLERYSSPFELVRDPLRDIVATLDTQDSVDLDSIPQVIEFIENRNDLDLVDGLRPELRHGPSHMSIEMADDGGLVRIYDGRGRGRGLKKEVPYESVIEAVYDITDLTTAMLNAFILFEQLLSFRYLDSSEFKYRMVENMDEDYLDD